jgi:hypothetical protein
MLIYLYNYFRQIINYFRQKLLIFDGPNEIINNLTKIIIKRNQPDENK